MGVNLTIKTAGGEYPVEVREGGVFSCNYDGTDYTDHTYSKLEDRIKDLAKRAVSMALPGTLMGVEHAYSLKPGNLKFTDITITGIHSGNGNMMYRRDDSPKVLHQSDRWGGSLMRRLTPDEQTQIRGLKVTAEQAQQAYDKCVAGFNLPREQAGLLVLWNNLKSKQPAAAPKAKGKAGAGK